MADQITSGLIEETAGHVELADAARAKRQRPWQRWIDAELGLRNYWYPAALSRQLEEGGHKAIKLLGEDILLTRQQGRVYALEDRCCHRGVRFSARPLFYTKETLTCWYHTWTYDLETGTLRTILNEPDSPLIGKCGLRAYPVEERKGVVFAYVGDEQPGPVEHDVAPQFLDDNAAVYAAEPYDIPANWRLACENGYDPGHQFIHNWSPFSISAGMHTSFGYTSKREDLLETIEYRSADDGPKGFTRKVQKTTFNHRAAIPMKDGSVTEIVLPLARGKSDAELKKVTEIIYEGTVGLWLPCMLRVTTFPQPYCTHYEAYVPKDATTHTYFQFGVIHTDDAARAHRWLVEEAPTLWEEPVVRGFTIDDAFARRQMQKFYAEENGWERERLYRPDIELTMWRKFASQHARGVQTREHAQGRGGPHTPRD
ncbi:MAG: Rieske 2Fe-2S domain-containing protein [Candidatus Binatia bacterium]